MYFRTPIITSRYSEMVETFGEILLFGSYYDSLYEDQLIDLIFEFLVDPNYIEKAELAHKVTKNFSWDSYSGSVVKIINSKINNKFGLI
jgi:glycosyltransferase involved in cell wall biosynthesis